MNKQIIKKVLDLIYSSIVLEGGDGDAIWFSKYTSLNNLVSLIEEYNNENKTNWDIKLTDEKHFLWGKDQEWVIITDNKEFFENQADWITLKINY